MPELSELMAEVPASITDTAGADITGPTDDTVEDDEETEEVEDETVEEGDEEDDEENEEQPANKNDEDDEDDFIVSLGDEAEEDPKKPEVQQPQVPGAPQLDDEGQYILSRIPKISVNLLMPTADGKGQETKQFQVYGWGDLPKDMLGFASPYEQGVFTASAQNNEFKARELQGEFRQQKVQRDTEAYTLRENRAIAQDLTKLRQEGMFPKFKGMPGSKDFEQSEGAKMFNEVIRFMNEQNDEAGKNAQKGGAFFHISFAQAYRMLHPEAFDTKRKEAQRKVDHTMARRLKSSGGARSSSNREVSTRRVTNITDLADEFSAFVGTKGGK